MKISFILTLKGEVVMVMGGEVEIFSGGIDNTTAIDTFCLLQQGQGDVEICVISQGIFANCKL